MAKQVDIKLNINADKSIKSMEDLNQELDQMKNELKTLAVGSDAFKKLQKEVVAADSKMKNLNKSVEGLDMDAVAGEVGKFAGGVGALTAAFVLFGDESDKSMKEIQENLSKGIAIFMAFKGATEVFTSGMKLAREAQIAFNAAMAANPIGLIVAGIAALGIGVGLLVANWDKLTGSYDANAEAAEKMININDEANTKLLEQKTTLIDIGIQLNNTTGKDRQKAIDDINKKYGTQVGYLDTTKTALDKISTSLLKQYKIEAMKAELIDIYKQQREALKGVNDETFNLSKVVDALSNTQGLSNIKAINEANSLGEEIKILEGEYTTLATAEFNETKASEDNTEAIENQKKAREELIKKLKKENDERIALEEKLYQKGLELNAKKSKKVQSFTDLLEEASDKEQEIDEEKTQTEIDNAEKIDKIKQSYADNETKRLDKELLATKLANKERIDNALQYSAIIRDAAGKETAVGKAAALANIGIATAVGVAESMKDAAVVGVTPIEKALIYASSLAQLFAAMSQAKSILSSIPKYARGGLLNGPSHANGGIATPFGEMEGGEAVINKTSTKQFAPVLSAINQANGGVAIGGNSGSIIDYDLLASKMAGAINGKIRVVSSDITKQQSIDSKIESRARF